MKILNYQRFREQWKSKMLVFLFSEAPFLRGFYFEKTNSKNNLPFKRFPLTREWSHTL